MINKKLLLEQGTVLTLAHRDFAKAMNSYSYFKVHNHSTSDDLVQDTFIKTWSYLARGGKIDLMKAFLYHVLNNLIIDEYRKRKNLSLDSLMDKGYEPSIDRTARNADIFDGKMAILMIDELPPRYRAVMRMRYAQELTLKEIAVLTGQSRNTVAVQAHRGLMKLKKLYNERQPDKTRDL